MIRRIKGIKNYCHDFFCSFFVIFWQVCVFPRILSLWKWPFLVTQIRSNPKISQKCTIFFWKKYIRSVRIENFFQPVIWKKAKKKKKQKKRLNHNLCFLPYLPYVTLISDYTHYRQGKRFRIENPYSNAKT